MNLFNIKNLNTDGKIIARNFSYLSLLRVFIILSQYLLISYLVRTLGTQNYGAFVWAFTIIQYLVIVVNFGFNTFAAKYVTENTLDPLGFNRIFSAITGIKLLLFFLGCVVLLSGIHFFPALKENSMLLMILLGFAFGEAIFPIWFFQGAEKLQIPTRIIFVFRLMLLTATLLLITESDHLHRYALLLTMTQILIGLAGLGFSVLKMDVRLVKFKWCDVKSLLKESSMFFIGAIFGKSFNFIAVLLIGIYCSMEQVASFDISFKIMAVMQLPSETLSTALFPTILRSKNKLLNQRIIFSGFLISLLLWGITYWQADFLMFLLGGAELSAYSGLLQQLSILIPVVVLTYLLGPNTLVAFGYQNQFNYSFIIPAIIYIFILAIIWKLGSLTFEVIVLSRILVDVLMAVYRLFVAVKYRLIFISR